MGVQLNGTSSATDFSGIPFSGTLPDALGKFVLFPV